MRAWIDCIVLPCQHNVCTRTSNTEYWVCVVTVCGLGKVLHDSQCVLVIWPDREQAVLGCLPASLHACVCGEVHSYELTVHQGAYVCVDFAHAHWM